MMINFNRFLDTRILLDVVYSIVVPREGVERAELVPATAQLLLGIIDESTNIWKGNENQFLSELRNLRNYPPPHEEWQID